MSDATDGRGLVSDEFDDDEIEWDDDSVEVIDENGIDEDGTDQD